MPGLESSITAMNLLQASYDGNVTLDQIDPNRAWQSALISPMGGRLVVERMTCESSPTVRPTLGTLTRRCAVDSLGQLDVCPPAPQLGRDAALHPPAMRAFMGRGSGAVRFAVLRVEPELRVEWGRVRELLQQ